MTNSFDSGAIMSPQGWIAYYRDVRWSQNRVLRDGKYDIIFATEQEAKDAGHQALLDHLNGGMVGDLMTSSTPTIRQARKAAADRLFRKGKEIQIERIGA